MIVAACSGGDSESTPTDGSGAETEQTAENSNDEPQSASIGDGTRIFVVSGPGDSISLIDIENETEEVFFAGDELLHNLVLIGDSLWFGSGENALVRVDAMTGEETGRTEIPGRFEGEIDILDDAVWIVAGSIGISTQLVGIDTNTMAIVGEVSPPQGSFFSLVAAVGGEVWVFGGDPELLSTVSTVDPTSFEQGLPVDTRVLADSMVAVGDILWVGGTIGAFANESGVPTSGVARVDTTSGQVDRFEMSPNPDNWVEAKSAFGSLWLTLGLDAELVKVDSVTGAETDRVSVGSGAAGIPYPMQVADGQIWVFNDTDDEMPAFDPETLELITGINVPPFSAAPVFAP